MLQLITGTDSVYLDADLLVDSGVNFPIWVELMRHEVDHNQPPTGRLNLRNYHAVIRNRHAD